MIKSMIEFSEKLITQFTWRRLFFTVIVIFVFGALCVWYETYTNHFRLNKIEHEIKVLTQLADLSKKVKENNDSGIANLLNTVNQEVEMIVNHNNIAFNIHPRFLKAIAAIFPWALMLILFMVVGQTELSTVIGLLICAIPFAALGAFLPTYSSAWINYFLYPIVHFIAVVSIVMIWHKKKNSNQTLRP
jgi:hypothetical protein